MDLVHCVHQGWHDIGNIVMDYGYGERVIKLAVLYSRRCDLKVPSPLTQKLNPPLELSKEHSRCISSLVNVPAPHCPLPFAKVWLCQLLLRARCQIPVYQCTARSGNDGVGPAHKNNVETRYSHDSWRINVMRLTCSVWCACYLPAT